MSSSNVCGTLPEIICNDHGVYEGNLKTYFKKIFYGAQNFHNGYHNFRHMFHVVWLIYEACLYYGLKETMRSKRNWLLAGMYHDYNHPGRAGDDNENIKIAVSGFLEHLELCDKPYVAEIVAMIRATKYPYETETVGLSLGEQVIRDADMGQSFSPAWLQQVPFGLANEWKKQPFDILQFQPLFLGGIKFFTDWGRKMFPQADIQAKIDEANRLVEILK